MRLSTTPERDEDRAIAVIHAALDAGARLLDTADAYALNDADIGHNERLIARALASWGGDRAAITVVTKGGLRRPKGRWVPDGRAKHLEAAAVASRDALGVDALDLYLLHAVDPRTSITTSARALARLKKRGVAKRVGLCNVTVSQIEAAAAVMPVDAVQVAISPFDDESLRNGVAEYCATHDIELIAHSPLGGPKKKRKLSKEAVLAAIAAELDVTPAIVALAWLGDLLPRVVLIPGATTIASAASLATVGDITIDEGARTRLDAAFSGVVARTRRDARRIDGGDGDVVIVMGMPAAGKSTYAQPLVADGYVRLNRDERGGRLSDLIAPLEEALRAGRRVVLDNTYAKRSDRNRVIEQAWLHGAPVRCVFVDTRIDDAQINAVRRMIAEHGALPTPEVIAASKSAAMFDPRAQYRYLDELDAPIADEGFAKVQTHSVSPAWPSGTRGAVCVDADVIARNPSCVPALERRLDAGELVAVIAWRPGQGVEDATNELQRELPPGVEVRVCPHPAGPPKCWCRKPLPGLVVELMVRHELEPSRCVIVGDTPADRTLAKRVGVELVEPNEL